MAADLFQICFVMPPGPTVFSLAETRLFSNVMMVSSTTHVAQEGSGWKGIDAIEDGDKKVR